MTDTNWTEITERLRGDLLEVEAEISYHRKHKVVNDAERATVLVKLRESRLATLKALAAAEQMDHLSHPKATIDTDILTTIQEWANMTAQAASGFRPTPTESLRNATDRETRLHGVIVHDLQLTVGQKESVVDSAIRLLRLAYGPDTAKEPTTATEIAAKYAHHFTCRAHQTKYCRLCFVELLQPCKGCLKCPACKSIIPCPYCGTEAPDEPCEKSSIVYWHCGDCGRDNVDATANFCSGCGTRKEAE